MFTPLNFPKTRLKLTKEGEKIYVWDIFRKTKLLLTPEEWVRQHLLHFLVEHKSVPLTLISSEFSIKINKMNRRCDAVIFNSDKKPITIIECKAPKIKLTEKTFQQIAQYNFKLQVEWLILSNGIETITAKVDQRSGLISYAPSIPEFSEMLT